MSRNKTGIRQIEIKSRCDVRQMLMRSSEAEIEPVRKLTEDLPLEERLAQVLHGSDEIID
jgi:hypothetical protein